MTKTLHTCLLLIFFSCSFNISTKVFATTGTLDNKWSTYLSYHHPTRTEKAGNLVYVLANGSLYTYDEEDESTELFYKGKLLNDVLINFICYSQPDKTLIIVYDNANIDLLVENKQVFNIATYKENTNIISKTVNQCTIDNHIAYLATSEGILLIDLKHQLVTNFYALGQNIKGCHIQNGKLYACTENEVLAGNLKDNLLDKSLWNKDERISVNDFLNSYGDKPIKITLDESITPDSPIRNHDFSMFLDKNGRLIISGGGHLEDRLLRDGTIMMFENNHWKYFQEDGIGIKTGIWYKDIVCVAEDPSDDTHHFAASCGEGLYEFKDGQFIAQYTISNSPLKSALPNASYASNYVRVGGLVYDDNNNLWMTNCETDSPIQVLKKDGTWKSFQLPALKSGSNIGRLFIDKRGWIWGTSMLPSSGGVFCLDYNQSIDNENDDQFTFISCLIDEYGNTLEKKGITSIIEDQDGLIWLGTNEGILIINKPENIFTNNYQCYQLKLLKDEAINCICVDAANRKWIGTENNGLFLLNSDGTEELEHFTTDNSPLLSKSIQSLANNPKTGELWIGTALGLVSYKDNIKTAAEQMNSSSILIYPNPVRPNFSGSVTIENLVRNSYIKILDITGNIIKEGTSNGGTFIWNLQNHLNRRVSSGVYIILATDENNKQRTVGKITVIN